MDGEDLLLTLPGDAHTVRVVTEIDPSANTLLSGTVAYSLLEGWSLLDSLYFSVISLATVGYGDLAPTTPLSKVFTVFYVLNGIAILLSLFDRIRAVRAGSRD